MGSPSRFFYVFDPDFQPDFTVEVPIVAFEPFRPIPQNPGLIIYRTRFQQLRAYYSKPVPNTPHPDLPQVYFVDDIDHQNRPGGMVEWTRVYATLPPSWFDFDSYNYEFPGYQGTLSVLGRNPFTHTVTAKLVNDYFMVGALPTFKNNIANYDNPNAATWAKGAVGVTGNVAAIPACAGGAVAGALIQADTTNVSHYIVSGVGPTGSYPGSFFVKRNDANVARLAIAAAGAPDLTKIYASVNLLTGQVIDSANCSPSVAAIGDGWWRLKIEKPVGSVTNVGLALAVCDDTGNPVHVQDIGLFAWRGMIDQTTPFVVPHATVPPTTTPDGGSYPILAADLIPFKFGTRYLYQVPWGIGATNVTATQFVAGYLSDGGFGLVATSPTLTNYKAFVSGDNANTNSYSIEATDSIQKLWQGSIWNRQRKFVKAI